MSQRLRTFVPAAGSLWLLGLLAACGARQEESVSGAQAAQEPLESQPELQEGGFLRVEAAETRRAVDSGPEAREVASEALERPGEPSAAASSAKLASIEDASLVEAPPKGSVPGDSTTATPPPTQPPRDHVAGSDGAAARGATGADVPAARAPDETPEARAAALLARGEHARAARAYSELLLAQLDSGGEDRAALTRLAAELARAQAGHRWNRRGSWPSFELTVEQGDSLIAIRKRALAEHPEILLCTGMIERTNGLASSTAIRPKDVLRIPTDRPSLLVDLSARWAFYRLGDEVAAAWEVGVGRQGKETPVGVYTIGLKQEDPMWSPVGREPVPFGAPDNPLGTRWLEWFRDGARTGYGFHGTNDSATVGQPVSEGCIRLRNPEVEDLFAIAPIGAEVRVQP